MAVGISYSEEIGYDKYVVKNIYFYFLILIQYKMMYDGRQDNLNTTYVYPVLHRM